MRTATLQRRLSTEEGTFGDWTSDTGFKCVTLERPSTGDHPCILEGIYCCIVRKSGENYCVINGVKDYHVYGLQDVEGRDDIEIHSANWFFQLIGCIAVGQEIVPIETPYKVIMTGINHSRDTLTRLMADMNREPFLLTIIDYKI